VRLPVSVYDALDLRATRASLSIPEMIRRVLSREFRR